MTGRMVSHKLLNYNFVEGRNNEQSKPNVLYTSLCPLSKKKARCRIEMLCNELFYVVTQGNCPGTIMEEQSQTCQ